MSRIFTYELAWQIFLSREFFCWDHSLKLVAPPGIILATYLNWGRSLLKITEVLVPKVVIST